MSGKSDRQDRFRIPAPDENRRHKELEDRATSRHRVLDRISQYLKRTSGRGDNFWDFSKGISLGCPLSPLIRAFFLNRLDAVAAKLRLFPLHG